MSIASGLTALVDVLITALNARSVPGPSDFQVWKAQDPVPRANATLADYRKDISGLYMTEAKRAALNLTELWDGREVTATDTGIKWKYLKANNNVTPNQPAGWRQWDSDWTPTGFGVLSGFAGGYGASNGWLSGHGMARYHNGKYCFRGNLSAVSGASVNNMICLQLPVAAAVPQGSSYSVPLGLNKANGTQYSLIGEYVDRSTAFWIGYIAANGGLNGTGPGAPAPWAQSDVVAWDLEYTPAYP